MASRRPSATAAAGPNPSVRTHGLADPPRHQPTPTDARATRFSFMPEPPTLVQRSGAEPPPAPSPTNSDIEDSPTSPAAHQYQPMAPAHFHPAARAPLETIPQSPASPEQPPLPQPFPQPAPRQRTPVPQAAARSASDLTYPRPMTVVAPRAPHEQTPYPPLPQIPIPSTTPPSYHTAASSAPSSTHKPTPPTPPAHTPIEPDHKPTFTSPTTPNGRSRAPSQPAHPHRTASSTAAAAFAPPPTSAAHRQASSAQFSSSLMQPDATCCLALVCPCMVYGRLAHRLGQLAARRAPTDLLGYEACGARCVGFGLLGCLGGWGLLTGWQRRRVRSQYGIEGDAGGDCIRGCCCCCCVMAQGEREVLLREESRVEGYRKEEGMAYAPPPR